MASTFWTWAKSQIEPYIDSEIRSRIDAVPKMNINEFGVDAFGFDPEFLKLSSPFLVWLYRNYFRCEVFGTHNVPKDGPILVIANHSGQLPFDSMMISSAFLLEVNPPRLLRTMAERWTAELPFFNTLISRTGSVVGEPRVCEELLKRKESVIAFPEGVRGINKLFQERYTLKRFGHGFMKLALKTNTPIVPVALIGAEEQAPAVANLEGLAKTFGFPAFPIIFPQIVPFPLPVKYRIYIGEPQYIKGNDEDPEYVKTLVEQTKKKIRELIATGLKNRNGYFH